MMGGHADCAALVQLSAVRHGNREAGRNDGMGSKRK